jgi:hypothetical protein
MVYVASIAFNTVSTAARINPANNQISVQVRGGGAHVAIDVVGYFKAAADATAMNIQVNGERVMRYEYNEKSPNVVAGFGGNMVGLGLGGQTIAGGGFAGSCGFNGIGTRSCRNQTSAGFATIGGGDSNLAQGANSTVGGGTFNAATQPYSTASGGDGNTASGTGSTVSGGTANTASGDLSTVIGGSTNFASGLESVAAGHDAHVLHQKTFVWNGWTSGTATSFRDNAFQIHGQGGLDIEYGAPRADGGGTAWVFIGNGFDGQAIATSTGAFLSTAGVWVPGSSSKATKTDFRSVDAKVVLDRLVRLPITTWRYKEYEGDVRHMGPMAEDFWTAFGIGYGDRTIADIDARGVAFAAIQGLHQLLREKDAQIEAQERRIEAQQRRMDALEATVVEMKHAWQAIGWR